MTLPPEETPVLPGLPGKPGQPGQPTMRNGQYKFPASWTRVDISRWKIERLREGLSDLDQMDEEQKTRSPEERAKFEAAGIEAFGPNWKEKQRADDLKAIANHEALIAEEVQKGIAKGSVVNLFCHHGPPRSHRTHSSLSEG